MRVLLDTHALLWAITAPDLLSPAARKVIAKDANALFVSAATAWEIAAKVRLGKLPFAVELEARLLEALDEFDYALLPIDGAIALRAARFPSLHRDPFDRMIAAHAIAEDIPLLSNDRKMDQFGVRRIW